MLRAWRRRRILERGAIPDPLWQRVAGARPPFAGLDTEERRRLRELTVLFLHRKPFYGAQGFVVDDYMRVCIAAQACLLILELGLEWYRGWRTVLVYEGAFVARHSYEDDDGLVHEETSALDGETSGEGSVILSWDEVDPRAPDIDAEAGNVVIHEFAHKLDFLNGDANGLPPLHGGMSVKHWSEVFGSAYEEFCALVDGGALVPFDDYAAESPAEFFAVTSEVFFTAPWRLRHSFGDVYSALAQFYRQDPAARLQPA